MIGGDQGLQRRIELRGGLFALVDDEDASVVASLKWYADRCGTVVYASTHVGETKMRMHRLVLGMRPGDRTHVDHINGNGLDNRRSNLRLATKVGNAQNSRKHATNANRPCTSRFKGVCRHWNGSWCAYINAEGRRIYLGLYRDEMLAALAYDRAARKMFGVFARPNFPDEGVA